MKYFGILLCVMFGLIAGYLVSIDQERIDPEKVLAAFSIAVGSAVLIGLIIELSTVISERDDFRLLLKLSHSNDEIKYKLAALAANLQASYETAEELRRSVGHAPTRAELKRLKVAEKRSKRFKARYWQIRELIGETIPGMKLPGKDKEREKYTQFLNQRDKTELVIKHHKLLEEEV